MKVLFISYDGLTDPLGQSQILPYIKGLTESGIEYSVISFEKNEPYLSHSEMIREDLETFGIKWTALSYTKNPPVFSTLYDIFKLDKAIKKLLNSQQIDVIHCRSYISMFAAYPLTRKNNVKLIFDMHGF